MCMSVWYVYYYIYYVYYYIHTIHLTEISILEHFVLPIDINIELCVCKKGLREGCSLELSDRPKKTRD